MAEIKLRNINKEYILKRVQETDALRDEIEDLEDTLAKPQRIRKILVDELTAVAAKYGEPRRTTLVYGHELPVYEEELGAAAVGVNCSFGPEHLSSLVKNMKAVARVPLLIKPNAGMPVIADDGTAVYPMGPEEFARHMCALHELGADLIGGCCGTTPAYIAALRAALEGAR